MRIIESGHPDDAESDYFSGEIEGQVYPIGGEYSLEPRRQSDGSWSTARESCDRQDIEALITDARENSPGGMPPLLLEHDSAAGPIGQVTDMFFEDGWLHARARLYAPKQREGNREVRASFRAGKIKGFSIGWDLLPGEGVGGRPKRRFVEISAVAEPYFPNKFESIRMSAKHGATGTVPPPPPAAAPVTEAAPATAPARSIPSAKAGAREYLFSQTPAAATKASVEIRASEEEEERGRGMVAFEEKAVAAAAAAAAARGSIRVYTAAAPTNVRATIATNPRENAISNVTEGCGGEARKPTQESAASTGVPRHATPRHTTPRRTPVPV
jgi:hypothetical protein